MSTEPPEAHRALQHLLHEEAQALRALLALLEQEQDVLVRGDPERLLPIANEKNESFARLAALAEQRHRALAQLGFAADRAGMEAWLAGGTTTAAARKSWEQLLEELVRARELNRTNGILIATRLQHNQQALQALTSAANRASLYGPDGQARAASGGRHLGTV